MKQALILKHGRSLWFECVKSGKHFSKLSSDRKNAESIHEAAMCRAMAEEDSPDNGVGERGSERTEIKMQSETCHNGPGQMVVVNTVFGECYIIMNRILCLSCKKNIMYFEVFAAMAALTLLTVK